MPEYQKVVGRTHRVDPRVRPPATPPAPEEPKPHGNGDDPNRHKIKLPRVAFLERGFPWEKPKPKPKGPAKKP